MVNRARILDRANCYCRLTALQRKELTKVSPCDGNGPGAERAVVFRPFLENLHQTLAKYLQMCLRNHSSCNFVIPHIIFQYIAASVIKLNLDPTDVATDLLKDL